MLLLFLPCRDSVKLLYPYQKHFKRTRLIYLSYMINKKRKEVFNFFHRVCRPVFVAKEFLIFSFCLVLLLVLISQLITATNLSCSIIDASSCSSPNVTLFRLLNETSGYFNAHTQNSTLSGYTPIYNYSLCCSSDSSLSTSRFDPDAVVLKLSNFTNAHVQIGSYTGPNLTYDYSSCLSSDVGALACAYSTVSCSEGYSCIASMASSESWASNVTDSHVGPCSEYNMKICCKIAPPLEIYNVVLNSSYGTNY